MPTKHYIYNGVYKWSRNFPHEGYICRIITNIDYITNPASEVDTVG